MLTKISEVTNTLRQEMTDVKAARQEYLIRHSVSRGLGLPVLKTVAVHLSMLLEPTEMAAVTLICAPRLEHCMVLGPVLGQVAEDTTIINVLVTSKETKRGPTPDIIGAWEAKLGNVPNPVSTPSKPREGSLLAASDLALM
ncbi:hypothetical protein J6590_078386 [Homalodisca vitripennis]|nr:hypothetical protein J6590_078386 [Homalodisca vitripennis]